MSEAAPRLTKRQAAIIGAFTGISCGPFADVHEYVEEILGRPVLTHMLADEGLWLEIREAAREDFMAIVAEEQL